MKATAFILALFISIISNAQTNSSELSGQWIADASATNAPVGFHFLDKGQLKIYETKDGTSETFNIMDGHYYYEQGSDLLVTITWYGEKAKTTEYSFSLNDQGQLILNQTYPEVTSVVYEKKAETASSVQP
ncbi:hypothetical protein K6119_17275 [Paracrocinitomix mangrovi]|uniref:hypothetical protein n=1 Tax=Paracrocinitomix mangrovi TaxID=2862509 RepID=UPI001C8EB807|nr:hypothetical protein [Paracrocinitomix mangrovi]UKN01478.1 hypothetical protein K6119_17275 [Paracrocinitomix mangrovi]